MKTLKTYKKETSKNFSEFLRRKGIDKNTVFNLIETNEKKFKTGTPRQDIVDYSGSIYFSSSMSVSREKINRLFRAISFKF